MRLTSINSIDTRFRVNDLSGWSYSPPAKEFTLFGMAVPIMGLFPDRAPTFRELLSRSFSDGFSTTSVFLARCFNICGRTRGYL